MKEPKNWLVGVILVAIIGFMVNQVGGCLFSSNEMTVKLDPETIKLLKENQKSELKIFIEGKETKVSKPNSEGEVKIKVSEENDGKKAELKVVDKEGKDLKKKDIVLSKPKPKPKGFPVTITTPDNFKFEFTDIKRNGGDVMMAFKVTNLDKADRNLQLKTANCPAIFYTDSGTQHKPYTYCLADRCTGHGTFLVEVSNLMPANIYLNGSVHIPNVDKNATTIKRGIFSYNGKTFELTDIELPTI